MGDNKLAHTITRLSIKGAYKQWTHEDLAEDTDESEMDDIALTLDAALTKAYAQHKVQEVLDTVMPDQATYLAKLVIPNRGVLIGVVTDKNAQQRTFERRWRGESNKILVFVCSVSHTAARFRDGKWKSVDGKPVLGNLDEESRMATGTKQCTLCTRWLNEAEDFYFVSGKPRKQCKDCYKEYLKTYRENRKNKNSEQLDEVVSGRLARQDELTAYRASGLEHSGFVNPPDCPTSLGQVWTGMTQPVLASPNVVDELRCLFELEAQQLKDLEHASTLVAATRARISALVGVTGVPA